MCRLITGRVAKVRTENEIVRSIYIRPLKKIPEPKPGQFFMVWVPGYEEVPMSVSGYDQGVIRISVAKVGETTERLHRIRVGEYLGLKGPLGNGLMVEDKRYLLVGGGYGVAPLVYTMKKIHEVGGEVSIIIGARTRSLLLFEEEASRYGEVYIATDDGSKGYRGTAADLASKILSKSSYDEVVVCGPEPLLVKIATYCMGHNIACRVFAEEYMKCGLGLCGSCTLGNTPIRLCIEGPVIDGELFLSAVKQSNHRNRTHRCDI
mgnify:CR=1 FL=1